MIGNGLGIVLLFALVLAAGLRVGSIHRGAFGPLDDEGDS